MYHTIQHIKEMIDLVEDYEKIVVPERRDSDELKPRRRLSDVKVISFN
jgi:hypothetical protein